jgi:contractile injection system tube protein/LysM domain-containing protein
LADSALVKASLQYKDPGEGVHVKFAFNPTEYTISASQTWKQTPAKGKDGPKSEFTGTLPETLSMDVLFLDHWAGQKIDVTVETFNLRQMTKPSDASVSKDKPSAPVLLFHWGKQIEFYDCHLKSVSIKYTMFNAEGDPTRALASIVLERVLAETPKQNPTSGGPGGNRAHVVGDGDTLASIAWHEYDNAALWRGLADLNGIDDPMSLRIGQRLIVPPFEQAAARS